MTDPARSARVGLCAQCKYARVVTSAKGSEFWMCLRSQTEPEKFRKYPPLPVLRCAGYEPASDVSRR